MALEIVQLIDDYYTCLNSANPNDRDDSDYEKCWNLLSDRPGEIQSNSSKKEFIDYWKKFKATYELYFCLNNGQPFVHSRYFIYNRNNDFQPIRSDPYYLEFVLAHDSSGWRIKGANYLENIGSFCESQPRVSKVEVP